MFTMVAVAAIALTPVKLSAQAPEPQTTPDGSTPEEQPAPLEEDTPPEQSVPTDEDTPVEPSTPEVDQNSIAPPITPAIRPPAQYLRPPDRTPEPAASSSASPGFAEAPYKQGEHGNYGWIGLLGLIGLAGLLRRRPDQQSRRYRST
jgi:MYXO-CTERM domain-containing protein